MKTLNILLLLLISTGAVFAQSTEVIQSTQTTQSTLSGTVLDETTREPIPNLHIHWVRTGQRTVTDTLGYFELENPEQIVPPIQLEYSHIRYGRGLLTIQHWDASTSIIITLMESLSELSPVTVLAHRPLRDPQSNLSSDQDVLLSIDSGAFLTKAANASGIRRGGFGLDPVLRGMGSNRLNIRVDGLASTTAACPNRMDPPTSHIRMSEMERVEIHMGPHALEFGPSFGGTVNYITTKPTIDESTPFSGIVRTGYETNTGHQKSDLQLRRSSNNWTISITGGQSQTHDYTSGDGREIPGGFTSYDLGAESQVHIKQEHSLYAGWAQSFVRDAEFPSLGMDMAIDDTYKFKGGYLWQPENHTVLRELRFDGYWNFVDHEMNNHLRPAFQMMDATALAETRSSGFKFATRGRTGTTSWNLVATMDRTDVSGTRYVDFKMGPNAGNSITYNLWQDAILTNTGLYAGAEHIAGSFTFTGGARLDYNVAGADTPAPRYQNRDMDSSHLTFSASVGALYTISPRLEAGIYLGRGVRNPDVTERYINYLTIGRDGFEYAGNPDLKPEANHQADLMIRYEGAKLQARATLFLSYMTDYISAVVSEDLPPVTAPGVREFQNRGDALFQGFELETTISPGNALYAGFTASYTRAEYTDDSSPVAEIPPMEVSVSVGTRLFNGALRPELSIRHAFVQDRFDTAFGESETPAFTVVDLQVRSTLGRRISLSAGVRNLLDEAYYEHLNRRFNPMLDSDRTVLYEPGRRIYAEISYRF